MSVAYSPAWRHHWRQRRQEPGLRATARRHRPVLEELSGGALEYMDIAPGRDVPVPLAVFCALCFGQRRIWEPAEDGTLLPVVCEACGGAGRV